MKQSRYLPLMLCSMAVCALLGACKQDLGQDPPFNYPPDEPAGVEMPDPLYHLAFDGDLLLEGSLEGTMQTFTGTSPLFIEGQRGSAYRNIDGQALILTPDAAAVERLESIGSCSVFLWIRFDGSNRNATSLFSIGNRSVEVADFTFFLNNGDTADPGRFFFKGYMLCSGVAGRPDAWFDAGGDAQISGMADRWAHVGMVYDAATSTARLYHDGAEVCNRVLGNGSLGALRFDGVSGLCMGAFPSQVGLGSGSGWTAEATFYTGAMDELYLYDVALTPQQVAALYESTK